MKILFIPHNAYHARTFLQVVPHLEPTLEPIFFDIDKIHGEGAGAVVKDTAVELVPFAIGGVSRLKPAAVVTMNDWGGIPVLALREARRLGIPSIAHVEGVQDYLDTHLSPEQMHKRRYPYSHSDYVFAIGDFDREYIAGPTVFTTGSPRFDGLKKRTALQPEKDIDVGINLNFSYGVMSDVAERWITEIIEACKRAKLSFRVSRHIADRTPLPEDSIWDGGVYDLIQRCKVFVSRFSTCMIESLILKTPVIYHNPHGEQQVTFRDPMGAYPITRNISELEKALTGTIEQSKQMLSAAEPFLQHHVTNLKGNASIAFADALRDVVEACPPLSRPSIARFFMNRLSTAKAHFWYKKE